MTPFVAKNPDVIRMPKKRTSRVRTKIAYMSQEQVEAFLKTAKDFGVREYAMFLLALNHGMRVSEICELKLADIDLKNEQIIIRRKKDSLHTTQPLVRFKGNPLFNELNALKTWLAVRPPDGDTFVFNTQKANKMNPITAYKLFRQIATNAGLPESLRHPHVAKHTCAMTLVRNGANAFMIRQYLGHKSFNSTLVYVNPTDSEASQAAIQAFSRAFG